MPASHLYLSVAQAMHSDNKPFAVFVLTEHDPDDLYGEEIDDTGIFIERVKGCYIEYKSRPILAAARHLKKCLNTAGITVTLKVEI